MTKEQVYEWILRFSFHVLLIFIFLFIFLHPLWKLSKTRPTMIIVFSRAIGSFLRLLKEVPSFLFNYILCISPSLAINLLNANANFYDTVLATHILALAVNRAHAMIFPFHYKWFSAKKRNFYITCALLWLFSFIVASVDQTMWILRRWAQRTLYFIILKICIYIAAFCYGCIACKMIWLKYKKNSTLSSDASSEKDMFRILIVCFSCLIMASFRYLILDRLQIYYNDWSENGQRIFTWFTFFAVLLSTCAEEICLLFLVRDFRNDVKQQFRRIFCCFTKKSSSINNMNNNINIVNVMSFSSTNPRIQMNNWMQKN